MLNALAYPFYPVYPPQTNNNVENKTEVCGSQKKASHDKPKKDRNAKKKNSGKQDNNE